MQAISKVNKMSMGKVILRIGDVVEVIGKKDDKVVIETVKKKRITLNKTEIEYAS
jgi:hypothetical protein